MPSTLRRSLTAVKPPCAARASRIRCASTGPTPGSESRSASVAELRLTGVPGAGAAAGPGTAAAGAAAPDGGGTPTTMSSPSTTLRAGLSIVTSTPGPVPPAACIASATREPDGRCTRPGRRTLPATATTTWAPDGRTAFGPPSLVLETGTTAGGSATGSTLGRDRQASRAAITTTTAATAARARTPRRPGSKMLKRRSPNAPAPLSGAAGTSAAGPESAGSGSSVAAVSQAYGIADPGGSGSAGIRSFQLSATPAVRGGVAVSGSTERNRALIRSSESIVSRTGPTVGFPATRRGPPCGQPRSVDNPDDRGAPDTVPP